MKLVVMNQKFLVVVLLTITFFELEMKNLHLKKHLMVIEIILFVLEKKMEKKLDNGMTVLHENG